MKNMCCALAIALVVAVEVSGASGQTRSGGNRGNVPLGNNPHPVLWGGQKTRPPSPAPHAAAQGSHRAHDVHHHRAYRPGYCSGGYGSAYRYDAYYYGYSDPYYYDYYAYPRFYYAYPPPVLISAENLFGPQSMRRFMGVDNSVAVRSDVGLIGPLAGDNLDVNVPEPRQPDRFVNAQATALAWRFIGFGDAQFVEQKYLEANARYRKAVRAAPELADAQFRQAFALTAMHRYEQAVTAIERGLKIDPNWPRSGFDIAELYADELAKDAYVDALAAAADENPLDANLLFLLGVHLHFDRQAERAKMVFQRATKLAGDGAEHIRAFAKN